MENNKQMAVEWLMDIHKKQGNIRFDQLIIAHHMERGMADILDNIDPDCHFYNEEKGKSILAYSIEHIEKYYNEVYGEEPRDKRKQ